MLADFWTYLHEIIGVWITGYWVVTAAPEALSYIMPKAVTEKSAALLDQLITPETRQRFYRVLFLVGIFIAGFIAWEDRYQGMVNDWKPQVAQRDKAIAKLQDDDKRTIAQLQDNARQQSKQFDEKIKACSKGYDALLYEITEMQSKSGPLLDQMTHFREQFYEAKAQSLITATTYGMAFKNVAQKFQDRWQNPCNE